MRPPAQPPSRPWAAPVLLFVLWLYLTYTHGGLEPAVWGFAAAVLLLGAGALLVTGRLPRRLDGTSVFVLALFGLYSLWVWLSLLWSQAPALTLEEAGRTTFYLAVFAVALLAFAPGGTPASPSGPHPPGRFVPPARPPADPLAYLLVATAGVLIGLAVIHLVLLGWGEGASRSFRFAYPLRYANHAAAIYLVSFWPLLGLAQERALPLPWRAAALGLTAPAVQLAVLAQTRGALLSLALVSGPALLLLPHRLRALAYLALPALVAALTLLPLNAYWSEGSQAMTPLLPAGYLVLAFLAGAVAALVLARLETRLGLAAGARRLIGGLVAAGLIAVVFLGLALAGAGLQLPGEASTGRLLRGGGTGRGVIWRAALEEFRREPGHGVGAGTFVESFHRLVEGNLEPGQPHNLLLKALAETGLVGAGLLFGVFGLAAAAVAWARFGRLRTSPAAGRVAQERESRAGLPAVYLLLGFLYFLVHAQIEALWFMPAVALPALLLLGAALVRRSPKRPEAHVVGLDRSEIAGGGVRSARATEKLPKDGHVSV
jgi:O-antigen ligase